MARFTLNDRKVISSIGKSQAMFLLDSNILIYIMADDQRIIRVIRNFQPCVISVISKLEVLLGADKDKPDFDYVKNIVDQYASLFVDNDVANKALEMKHKDGVNLKFKDLLIAATAKEHGFTLVTADKDFKKLKGIDVEFINLS